MNLKLYRNTNSAETIESFRFELFKELDLKETTENLNLFERAWAHGHEGGFEEVYFHFWDLVDMMQNETSHI